MGDSVPPVVFRAKTVTTVRNWISECTASHPSCCKVARHSSIFCTDNSHYILDLEKSRLRPLRLLQVRNHVAAIDSTGDHEDRIFLVLSESVPREAEYMTLSHRWGAAEDAKTTRSNAQNLTDNGMPLAEMPRTFRDAVHVTRSLGYSYLWIDSFCIVQDDEMEWKKEARRMAIIYDNAVCNIMAMDGSDADSGLIPAASSVHDQVLDTRAWVFQERMASPRSLIFTRGNLIWECREAGASEEGPMRKRAQSTLQQAPSHPKDIFTYFRDWRLPMREKSPEQSNQGSDGASPQQPDSPASGYSDVGVDHENGCITINYDSNKLPGHTQHMKNHIYEHGSEQFDEPAHFYPNDDGTEPFGHWLKIVTNLSHPQQDYFPFLEVWWQFLRLYTPRRLTFETDKFLAINGLTTITQRWTHMRNTFGLWFSFLEYELCWYVDVGAAAATRPTRWLGPSWSWVSTLNGCVRNDFYGALPLPGLFLMIAPEVRTPVATSFDMPLPFQAWKPEQYHSMELTGILRPADVSTAKNAAGELIHTLSISTDGRFSDSEILDFRPDCGDDFPVGVTRGVFCLLMWHCDAEILDRAQYKDVYLVLKQTAAGDENIPITTRGGEAAAGDSLCERRMKRLGYLEVTYAIGQKRSSLEIYKGAYRRWIQLV